MRIPFKFIYTYNKEENNFFDVFISVSTSLAIKRGQNSLICIIKDIRIISLNIFKANYMVIKHIC